MERTEAITKILSRNDTGETGGHQSGILIPKAKEILSFFPPLDSKTKNPRRAITFEDKFEKKWIFSFIYYNNKFFGGTRNEYRLTRMTSFINRHNLKHGDQIILKRNEGFYKIIYKRLSSKHLESKERLVLGNSWRIIKFIKEKKNV